MPKHDFYESMFSEETVTPSQKTVPNKQPLVTNSQYKIAIVGEAPGSDEVSSGTPFVGASGRELDKYLSKCGILRDACFVGNICQHQALNNKIANFEWLGPEIQNGLDALKHDLSLFKPNLVWCLGGSSLHAFKCGNLNAPKTRKTKDGPAFVLPHPIGDWRGSLFISHPDSPCPLTKTVASYHPAAALRNYEWMPLILLDLLFKVCKESKTPELKLPERNLLVDLDFAGTLNELQKIQLSHEIVSVDIEGGVGTMSCLSLATSPSLSLIVPFTTATGQSIWSVDEETTLLRAVGSILANPNIPKVLQNSLYDRFVLQYSYGIVCRGVVDDTMLKHWELYCELEKSLGFQCSLYTDEPFYKSDRKSDSRRTFWEYCCRDSATTHEINGKLSTWLHGTSKEHYKFNVNLLNPLLYMELRGIRYDSQKAKELLEQVNTQIYEMQFALDNLASCGIGTEDNDVLRKRVRDTMCYKADPSKIRADYTECYPIHARRLRGDFILSIADRGQLSIDLGLSMNLKSPAFKDLLYETLKLPKQYDPKTKSLTTDYFGLLCLSKLATTQQQKDILSIAIDLGQLRTRSQMLGIHADSDGRVRCGYNVVGSETGRLTCYTSPTGSGYNLQTIPSENTLRPPGHPLRQGMRDLFIADPGCYLFQCDLSGADGWTIGANLASLGERTMLDDLLSKIKPASRVCYILRHGAVSLNRKERDEVKTLLSEVKKEDWDYVACKMGIWGICYLMGPDRLAQVILEQSEGKISMSRSEVKDFRDAVYAAYHPNIWHRAMQAKLSSQAYPPKITCASGHTRMFFGRYNEILGEALSHEPQANTTYATNKAVYNLWNDPENRIGRKLRIEPLHQVHDALIGQFKTEDTEWAKTKIHKWFDNKMFIAGIPITIPFSGTYGPNWAFDKETIVGEI